MNMLQQHIPLCVLLHFPFCEQYMILTLLTCQCDMPFMCSNLQTLSENCTFELGCQEKGGGVGACSKNML